MRRWIKRTMDKPEISVTGDGLHIMIGEDCLTLEEAEAKAGEILDKTEYARIWGNRNDRR